MLNLATWYSGDAVWQSACVRRSRSCSPRGPGTAWTGSPERVIWGRRFRRMPMSASTAGSRSLHRRVCRAAADAVHFEERVRSLQDDWHGCVGSTRRDSAVRHWSTDWRNAPVVTTAPAAKLIGRSFQATNQRFVDSWMRASSSKSRWGAATVPSRSRTSSRSSRSSSGSSRARREIRGFRPRCFITFRNEAKTLGVTAIHRERPSKP